MKKNNIYLLILLVFSFNISLYKSQIFSINTPLENIPPNSHLKDLDNEFLQFIGIYKAIHKGNEITIFINKINNKFEKSNQKNYYMDVLDIKYIVKSLNGDILQDTQNINLPEIEFYSIGTKPNLNKVIFYYSGTQCNIGWGSIYLTKINSTQISWEYRPNSILSDNCPNGTNKTLYLPVTSGLIFTKQ